MLLFKDIQIVLQMYKWYTCQNPNSVQELMEWVL